MFWTWANDRVFGAPGKIDLFRRASVGAYRPRQGRTVGRWPPATDILKFFDLFLASRYLLDQKTDPAYGLLMNAFQLFSRAGRQKNVEKKKFEVSACSGWPSATLRCAPTLNFFFSTFFCRPLKKNCAPSFFVLFFTTFSPFSFFFPLLSSTYK